VSLNITSAHDHILPRLFRNIIPDAFLLLIEANAVGTLVSMDMTEIGLGTSSNQVNAFEAAFATLWDPSNVLQSALCRKAIVLLSDSSQSPLQKPSLSFSLDDLFISDSKLSQMTT
jgi:hypothetical protein